MNAIAAPISEKTLQAAVVETASLFQWMHYHTWDSRKSARGFPDLVLVRGERLVFAELKSVTGRISAAQAEWIAALRETGAEGYFWTPTDWLSGAIEECLK